MLIIPKSRSPTSVDSWRPISLVAVLHNVYLQIVGKMFLSHSRAIEPELCGFRAGRQASEMVEVARSLLSKGAAWGKPFTFVKGNVSRAVDNIRHEVLEETFLEIETPARIQTTLFTDLTGSKLCLNFQGHEFDGVEFCKGGRQGGTDTPSLWNSVVNMVVRRSKDVWRKEKLGIRLKISESLFVLDFDKDRPFLVQLVGTTSFAALAFVDGDEFVIFALIWADDCLLLGEDEISAHRRWEVFTLELHRADLKWKPGSLVTITAWHVLSPDDAVGEWKVGDQTYLAPSVDKFVFLGGLLTSFGCPVALAEFRCGQAWSHFWARKKQITCREVPLKFRWSRPFQPVGRTCLYLSGYFIWNSAASVVLVSSTIRKMLSFKLSRAWLPQEAWGDYHHRMRNKVSDLCEKWGFPSVEALGVRQHVGWIGPFLRQGHCCPAAFLTSWRDSAWWDFIKHDSERPRYALRGRQHVQNTNCLSEYLGPQWQLLAANRELWKCPPFAIREHTVAEAELLCATSPGNVHAIRGFRAYETIISVSSNVRDLVGNNLPRSNVKLPIVILSDCDPLVLKCIGKSEVPEWPVEPSDVAIARIRWLHYLVEYRLPFCRAHPEELMIHRPRALNSVADWVCNLILDEVVDDFLWIDPVFTFFAGELGGGV
jgi:hypothetical protein